MKETIKYFYNIEIDEYSEKKAAYIIKSGIKVYIFKKIKVKKDEIKNIIDICAINNVKTHKVLINKENEIFTKFNDEEYILMEVQSNKKIMDVNYSFLNKYEQDTIILEDKWSKKVDFFIKQINEFGVEKKELVKIANYYIGLAENAIGIYNEAIEEGKYRCAIQHRRICYPNYAINYFDPTEMIVDCVTRDYAEYYKTKFIRKNLSEEEILVDIEKNNFTLSEIKILYARMLYPTYFFDYFENDIVKHEFNKEDLIKIISKREKYMCILMKLGELISKKYKTNKILWIKKEL